MRKCRCGWVEGCESDYDDDDDDEDEDDDNDNDGDDDPIIMIQMRYCMMLTQSSMVLMKIDDD